MRRTAFVTVAGLTMALTAPGCSNAQSSTQPTTSTTTSTTVPASPVASSTTSTPSPSTQPVSTSSSSSSSSTSTPGEVALSPGSAYTITGSGCTPGVLVQVTLEAPTHATASLASQPSDSTGAFSIAVEVPRLNSPTADLSANCVSTNAKGYVQIDVPIHFTG